MLMTMVEVLHLIELLKQQMAQAITSNMSKHHIMATQLSQRKELFTMMVEACHFQVQERFRTMLHQIMVLPFLTMAQ